MTNEIHECELLELGAFMRRHEEFVERLASYRSSINKKYEDFTTRAAFKKLLQLQEQYVDRCEQESWRKDPSKLWEISKQYCEQSGPTWLEVSKPYDSECTRVIWTKVEPAYAPTPYLCLTPFGYPGPKVLKGEPEKSGWDTIQNGFGEGERLLFTRCFFDWSVMRWESRFKVFYEYETTGDLAYEINCSVPNSWTQPIDVSISLLFFKDEKLARVIDGREIVYDYDDCGRIIKISVSEAGQRRLIARENYDRAKSVLISDVKERVSRVSYDASGLSEITECIRELDITNEPPVGAPKHTLVYKRRPSGATLSKVLVEIKDRLRELVVEMVEGYPSEDRLVAVCLMYEEGSSWPCPPYITVCSQESRESLMASGCSVWLGAEFSEPLKLPEDQRFDELCRLACEFIHLDNKWTSLKKCLFELAGELNDYEWKPAKKFSPEFVVFVAEARQRFNSLKSSTPQRKADILKRLNLL